MSASAAGRMRAFYAAAPAGGCAKLCLASRGQARNPGAGGCRMASFGERVVGAMRADVKTFEEIEADTTAMGQAVGVILLSGVAALIGNIFRAPFGFAIGTLLLQVV